MFKKLSKIMFVFFLSVMGTSFSAQEHPDGEGKVAICLTTDQIDKCPADEREDLFCGAIMHANEKEKFLPRKNSSTKEITFHFTFPGRGSYNCTYAISYDEEKARNYSLVPLGEPVIERH